MPHAFWHGDPGQEPGEKGWYARRLSELLSLKVAAGTLSSEQANRINEAAASILEQGGFLGFQRFGKGIGESLSEQLPYWTDINVTDDIWLEATNKLERDATKLQKTRISEEVARVAKGTNFASYLPQLEDYLAYWGNKGQITPEQADNIVSQSEGWIMAGGSLADLPNYANVVQFGKIQATQPEMERQQKVTEFMQERQVESLIEQQRNLQRNLAEIQGRGRASGLAGAISGGRSPFSAQQAEAFEQMRQQALAGADRPFDWIRRWELEHATNPFISPELNEEEEVHRLEGEVSRLEGLNQNVQVDPRQSENSTFNQLARILPQALENSRTNLAAARSELAEFGVTDVTPSIPSGPITPDWLAMLVPGLTAGEPLSRFRGETPAFGVEPTAQQRIRIPTPSGQQYSRLLPSQREKFAGFTEFAGVPSTDILARMQRMLPRTPQIAQAWRPPRQRVGV